MTAASGADQPTLRDEIDKTLEVYLGGRPGSERLTSALLRVFEADRERAKAEAAAEALEKAADEDDVSTAGLCTPGIASLRVVKTGDLRARAAALRSNAGGDGG